MSDYDFDFIGYDDGNSDYHESWVLASNNPKQIYNYAIHFKRNGDTSRIEKKLKELNDYKYIFLFLRDVKKIDIQKYFDAIIEKEDFKILYNAYICFYDNFDAYQRNLLNFAIYSNAKTEEDFKMLKEIDAIKSNANEEDKNNLPLI